MCLSFTQSLTYRLTKSFLLPYIKYRWLSVCNRNVYILNLLYFILTQTICLVFRNIFYLPSFPCVITKFLSFFTVCWFFVCKFVCLIVFVNCLFPYLSITSLLCTVCSCFHRNGYWMISRSAIKAGSKYLQSDNTTCNMSILYTENVNNRERPTGSTSSVDKYWLTWTNEGVRCCPKFQL